MPGGRTPEERFMEIINTLEQRIAALEAKPIQIPIVDADPSTDYRGNIWMFQDGRLHIRLPDGTMQELVGSMTSGSSTTTPKPVVPPQPVQTDFTWDATWSQAYRQAGGFTGGDAESLYYGDSGESSYNGRQSSLIGFDYANIQATLAGATVNKAGIYLFNKPTWAGT